MLGSRLKSGKTSFYLLVVSLFISSIGGAVLRFAISLHVLDLTGSAAVFSTMIAISMIPIIIFTPLGGAVADRVSKKAIIVIGDLGKTVAVIALYMLLLLGNESVILFGAVITLFSIIQSCYSPAVTASMPCILKKDELVKANGTMQAINALSGIAGPLLGGLLFGILGMTSLAAFCAVMFAFSVFINIFILIPHEKRDMLGSFASAIIGDMKEGFRYVAKEHRILLRACVIFAIVVFFFQAIISIAAPYIMRITLSMAEEPIGFVHATFGVSMLMASLLAGKFKKFMEIRHLAYHIIFIGLSAVPVAIATVANPEGLLAPVMLAGGIVITLFVLTLTNILAITYVQSNVKNEMLGKVIAMLTTTANFAAPAGQITLGFLIEQFAHLQAALYLGIGAFTVILGLVSIKPLSVTAK